MNLKTILDRIQAIEDCRQWEAVSVVASLIKRSPGSVNQWLYRSGPPKDTLALLVYRLREKYPTVDWPE